MLILAKIVFASLLIATASAVVLLWLSLLALSYGGQSGLMPWTAAGVILYGLVFVAIAAVVGVPGVLWANHLSRGVPAKWRRIARAPGWIGTATLVLGFVTAIAVLVGEQFRAKNPYDGCISYRDAATSTAMAASGPEKYADCPKPK